jgi:hypothetical protein
MRRWWPVGWLVRVRVGLGEMQEEGSVRFQG